VTGKETIVAVGEGGPQRSGKKVEKGGKFPELEPLFEKKAKIGRTTGAAGKKMMFTLFNPCRKYSLAI